MNLNYGELLKKAWTTIWKHKILWIFGILASCSARSSGSFNTGGSSSRSGSNFNNNDFNFGNSPSTPPAVRDFFWQMQRMANTGELWQMIAIIAIIVIILVVLLRLIMAVVGTIGQIGLINGTWQLEEGAEKISFGALVKDGWKYFWKVILFKLLLIGVGIALAIAVIILTLVTFFCGLILIIPALIVFSFVYWILVEYVMAAIVGDSMGIMDAIAKCWDLFKKSWVTSSIMGLLVAVINVVYGVIMLIPLILVMIPGGIGVFTAITTRSETGLYPGLIASGILLLIYIPIAIFLNGVKIAYFGVNWVLVYRQLTGRGTQPLPTPVVDVATPASDLPDLPSAEG
jgi:hypothetical protein